MEHVGVMFANGARAAEPDHAAALARAAERVGYESLWAVQHVVMPVEHASAYPYADTGTVPGGTAVAIPDPLVWLAWAGALTTRIRLATGVLVLPQQHPLVVAKQVATLDRLTGGRVIFGVGAVGFERSSLRSTPTSTTEVPASMRVSRSSDQPGRVALRSTTANISTSTRCTSSRSRQRCRPS